MPSAKVRRGLYWSDKSKTWHYQIRVAGRKYSGDSGCVIERDARVWLAEKRKAIRGAEVGMVTAAPAAPVLTLAELVALYCQKRSGGDAREGVVTAHTLTVIQLRLRLHWAALAELPADQISTAEVEDMRQAYLAGEGRRSKGGANKVVASLVTVLSWAVRRGLLPVVPFKVEKLKAQKAVKAVVWPEQIRQFLRASRACRNTDSRMAMLGCLTMGLREGEARGLRWEWCDWTAQLYRVGRAKDRDVRAIPMHPFFYRVLRARWRALGRPSYGLVLKASDAAEHRAGYLRKPVATAARALHIVGLHPHRLRASFATACWEAGASIAQIQTWLGHENESTTMLYIVKRDLDGRQVQARVALASGYPDPKPSKPVRAVPVESPEKLGAKVKPRKKAS